IEVCKHSEPVEVVEVVPLEHDTLDAQRGKGIQLGCDLIRCPHDPAPPAKLIRGGLRRDVRQGREKRLVPASLLAYLAGIAADERATHPRAPDPLRVATAGPAMLLEPSTLGSVGIRSGCVAVPL